MRNLIIISFLTLVFASCERGNNCFVYPGNKTEKTIALDNFDTINVNYLMDVEWYESNDHYVKVFAGENHINQIEATVANNTLELSNNNKCEWIRGRIKEIKVKVYSNKINKLIFRNNGSFTARDTVKNDFELDCFINQGSINLLIDNSHCTLAMESGGTDLNISGQSDFVYLYNLGINHFNGFNFAVKDFHINNASAGLNNIFATNSLLIEQNGTGNILYKGNPALNISAQSGKGKVVAK